MNLNNKLVKDFVTAVNKTEETKTPTTLTGTVHKQGGTVLVKIDGSESLTPVSTVTNVEDGERVAVTIDNHKAMIIGNISSPAARGSEVENVKEILTDKVDTAQLKAIEATVGSISGDVANFKETTTDRLKSNEAEIGSVKGDLADFKSVTSEELKSKTAEFEELHSDVANFKKTTTDKLVANEATVNQINGDFANFKTTTTEQLAANSADIKQLRTDKISSTDADLKYANIDFSNIGKSAMEYFYAQSGLVKDVTIGDATITGELVGVTISGDLIKGNTIVAEKLVIRGNDGLYYKLNTDGMSVEKEQTDYNSINGQVIRAKSITATKIDVNDLVAFGATIGGFKIGQNSIYSGVKESVDNTTRGIYMDNDGQVAFGDSNHYFRFYKIGDGKYKLAIALDELYIGTSNVESAIADVADTAGNAASIASEAKQTADTTSGDLSAVTKRLKAAETSIVNNNEEIALRAKTTEVQKAIDDKVADYYTKTETDASLKVLSEQISSTVKETTSLGTRLTTVEQDAKGWSVTLETANTAKSTADAANTAASDAQSTANSAKGTADTARNEAADAAKTATNYLGFDNTGLTVGDRTAGSLGNNVNINESTINIRKGTNVLASFAESLIEIGKNSQDASIKFLQGLMQLSSQSVDDIVHAQLFSKDFMSVGVRETELDDDIAGFSATQAGGMASMFSKNGGAVSVSKGGTTGYFDATIYGQGGQDTTLLLSADTTTGAADGKLTVGASYSEIISEGGVNQITDFVSGTVGTTQVDQWDDRLRFSKDGTLKSVYDGSTPVLASTGVYPNADTTINLSAPVSQQPHGIVLEFSPYNNGTVETYGHALFFVPKARATGASVNFVIAGASFDRPCCKWVYVHDTKIVGNNVNYQKGTTNGVTYNNALYVLTKVYGV